MDIEQLIGSTVREYYIQAQLGHGGMATVLLAWHQRLRVHRAIKIIKPQLLHNPEQEKAFRARLQREARLVCRLNHPNLVQGLDFFEEEGLMFLVMEFVLGETLTARARAQGGLLSLEETLSVVRQACLGMEFAHSLAYEAGNRLGLVHRDLSPDNLMVTTDSQGHGLLKVIDFGIARPTRTDLDLSLITDSVTDPGSFIGKIAYASPEQLCGMEVDARSDVYSLGAVAYKLLSGQPPLRGDSDSETMYQRITQPPPLLSLMSGRVWPVVLDALLLKAVATKPEDRYQSMAEFRAALDQSGLPAASYLQAPNIERPPCPPDEPQNLQTAAAIEDSRADDRPEPTPSSREPSFSDIDSELSRLLREAEIKRLVDVPPAEPAPRQTSLAKPRRSLAALFAIVLVISAIATWVGMHDGFGGHGPAVAGARTLAPGPTATAPAMTASPSKSSTTSGSSTSSGGATTSPTAERQSGSMPMVRIDPGEFMMGSPEDERDREADEVQHRVRISRAFLMGVTEVTQEQYETVMGTNPATFKTCGGDCPVENVSWLDAMIFCNRFSEREGLTPCYQGSGNEVQCDFTANGYRLPTEAEWEYACRAGNGTSFDLGNGEKDMERAGWHDANSERHTHPVHRKEANRWGLYDMHGNVWEWCWDWYSADYYGVSPAIDPRGAAGGTSRSLRGGSWFSVAGDCRSALRGNGFPDLRVGILGLRLARSLP